MVIESKTSQPTPIQNITSIIQFCELGLMKQKRVV